MAGSPGLRGPFCVCSVSGFELHRSATDRHPQLAFLDDRTLASPASVAAENGRGLRREFFFGFGRAFETRQDWKRNTGFLANTNEYRCQRAAGPPESHGEADRGGLDALRLPCGLRSAL